MTEQTEDLVQIAESQGALFTYNRDRGWYWGWQEHPSGLNGPCETQEEAADEFLEANAATAEDEKEAVLASGSTGDAATTKRRQQQIEDIEKLEDPVAVAQEQGADFTYNRDRGWYWGWKSSSGGLNGPCETREEAAREFLEANIREEDADAEPEATSPSI